MGNWEVMTIQINSVTSIQVNMSRLRLLPVMVRRLSQLHESWLVPIQDASILSLDFLMAAEAVVDLRKEMLGLETG